MSTQQFDSSQIINEINQQWNQFSMNYHQNFGDLGSLILCDFKVNPSFEKPLNLNGTDELKQISAMLAYQQSFHQDQDINFYLTKL